MVWGETGQNFAWGLWSGHGPARNDPTCTDQKGVGPLPVGLYEYGFARDGGKLGPEVLPLHQVSGETYGRSGFYIHGQARLHPENSSDGCIIMQRPERHAMDGYPTRFRTLEVRA